VFAVTDHLERPVPAVVARDVAVQPEDQAEEVLEEQVAVRRDRVPLEPPGRDTVGDPAGHVVRSPAIGGDERTVGVRVSGAVRVVADHRHPVDGGPPRRVSVDEAVEDVGMDLAPRRRDVGHHRDGVARVEQVEAREREHGRVGSRVPQLGRLPAAVPVVIDMSLAMEEPQPAVRAAGERRVR
jgi:hypothetical protein